MIGFSVGQASAFCPLSLLPFLFLHSPPSTHVVGPPVGGTLYDRFGWRAPFIFSIILVAIDLLMRLFIIEKHVALRWVKSGVVIKNFEAPGWNEGKSEEQQEKEQQEELESETNFNDPSSSPIKPTHLPSRGTTTEEPQVASKLPSHWLGFISMLTDPRPLTSFILTFLNGFILGGLLDTAMTIHLSEIYGLSSLGAGLVFLGAVVPTFIVRLPCFSSLFDSELTESVKVGESVEWVGRR